LLVVTAHHELFGLLAPLGLIKEDHLFTVFQKQIQQTLAQVSRKRAAQIPPYPLQVNPGVLHPVVYNLMGVVGEHMGGLEANSPLAQRFYL
jgi:hypothetical protein